MTEFDPSLSAPNTLLDLLSRAKTGEMDYVLGVLQPEQYQLATLPSDSNLVIDGSPGSGKTVIAVHRAGFLTHDERDRGSRERVLFVGPSSRWVRHISRAQGSVVPGDLTVLSMGQLEMKLAAASAFDDHPLDTTLELPFLQSPHLWKLISKSSQELQSIGAFQKSGLPEKEMSKGEKKKTVYSKIKKRDPALGDLCPDPELWNLLSQLPSQKSAFEDVRLNGYIAAIGQSLDRDQAWRFDHIIVDEGQELSYLQWGLLASCLNRKGAFTIFGDLNQRFSETGITDWSEIFEFLEIGDPVIRNNRLIFRSTRQIIEFANSFARKPGEDFVFLREGDDPLSIDFTDNASAAVVKTVKTFLIDTNYRSCAVFAIDREPIIEGLRRAGWSEGREHSELIKGQLQISVLNPRDARGLEFDAVIVVNPKQIQSENGLGQIYTCLTRAANRLYLLEPAGSAK